MVCDLVYNSKIRDNKELGPRGDYGSKLPREHATATIKQNKYVKYSSWDSLIVYSLQGIVI